MPFALFKEIHSVSSEDSIHCASNLLKSDPAKKWKTGTNGEKSAYIIFKLEKPEIITGVDVGNEHSAFIEVLVGKNGFSSEQFKELVLTSSFMTPIESKNSTNLNRIRCFNHSHESWLKNVGDEKWDLIKIICTQPFNKHVQYGLSLVKVHIAASREAKPDLVPKKFQLRDESSENKMKKNENNNSTDVYVGKFKLRDENSDSDESDSNKGKLFDRWKKNSTTPDNERKQNTAASIRDASRFYDQETVVKKIKLQKLSSSGSEDRENNTITAVLDRNRENLFFNEEDESSDNNLEKKISKDRERIEKTVSRDISENKDNKKTKIEKLNKIEIKNETKNNSFTSKMIGLFDDQNTSRDKNVKNTFKIESSDVDNTSHNKKRPSSDLLPDLKNAKKKKTTNIYKPFEKLLEGVVLVISGIQNPKRANIRNKAIALGAKYKPDWDTTCTHLICAFKNTPKYNQVKDLQGKIITKSWIEDCYRLKKRIPWRRYALDTAESIKPESEDEILELCEDFDSFTDEEEKCSTTSILSKTKNNEMESSDDFKSEKNSNKSPHSTKERTLQPSTSSLCSDKTPEKKPEKIQHLSTSDLDDEINKKTPSRGLQSTCEVDIFDATTDEDDFTKANKLKLSKSRTKNFFENLKFYLDPKLTVIEMDKSSYIIEEYGGTVAHSIDSANYIITNSKINSENLKNSTIHLVKPLWIYECNDMECLIPIKRYLL